MTKQIVITILLLGTLGLGVIAGLKVYSAINHLTEARAYAVAKAINGD